MYNLIGKIVCGYRILSEIGEGGMGKVYLAESAFLTEYKQQVAIKTLTTHASTEQQAAILRDLFTREANIQVQFKHPHIVSVIQFAVEGDHYFLILEYMPGYHHKGRRISNVADMISCETGPIPHKRAFKLFIQALDAMQYAHNFKYRWEGEERIGIVHRDIKPANLLLMSPETIKVSDFGIVKVQQRGVGVTQKLTPGTSAYMAPETILGARHFGLSELDARSDIYALGVTLFEMLAGRLPFSPDPDTNPDISLRRKHVKETPPPPSAFYPGIPPQIDQLVLRALEKSPEQRYQSSAEFKQAILALDSSLGLGLRDSLRPERPERPERFDTNPLAAPTKKFQTTTNTSAVSVYKASRKEHEAAVTAVMEAPLETQPHVSISPTRGTLKQFWWLGAAVLVMAAIAGPFLFRNRDKAESSTINPTEANAKSNSLPSTPEGMVLIPEGSFMMGRDLTDEQKNLVVEVLERKDKVFIYDYPAHLVELKSFFIDKTEVSNREYAKYVAFTGNKPPDDWSGQVPQQDAENLPVTHVNYYEAVDYCDWRKAQRNDGLDYRLPTEEEWEYAARGQDAGKSGAQMNLYPWGDDWRPGLANTKESRLEFRQTVESNPEGRSRFGVFNLSGNVFEWTSTDFKHYQGSNQQTPREKGYRGIYYVVRGGSFDYPKEYAMTTTRAWAKPSDKGPRLGFRCAADARR